MLLNFIYVALKKIKIVGVLASAHTYLSHHLSILILNSPWHPENPNIQKYLPKFENHRKKLQISKFTLNVCLQKVVQSDPVFKSFKTSIKCGSKVFKIVLVIYVNNFWSFMNEKLKIMNDFERFQIVYLFLKMVILHFSKRTISFVNFTVQAPSFTTYC